MLDLKKIKLVGFDLDQTLYKETKETFRIYRQTAYRLAARELGISTQEAEKQFLKNYQKTKSGREALKAMGIKDSEKFSLNISASADLSGAIRPDPKLVNLLDYLASRYDLFLVTSSAKVSALLKLKALGVDPAIFKHRIFGDDFLGGKSSGVSFQHLLRLTGVKPECHLFIGDKEEMDVLPPQKLGFQTALVWGSSRIADFFLPTIYDLKNKL